jgi:enoyl-CoA hydratase
MGSEGTEATADEPHEPHLLFERDGHTAIVTLNRPAKKNALSSEMLVRMHDAWLEIDRNPDIRVAIVTGAGGNFCSGADLKAMAAGHPDDEYTKRFATDSDLHWKALLRHFVPMKPLIAAVEGYAVAGGTEILQAHDIRVAGESATFGVAEVRRGLFPLGGSTVRLSRQIPYTVAAELLLTGRFVSAEEALRVGLIGHVVPDGQALTKAREIAEEIAANGPLAVQAVLKSMRATREMPEKIGLAYELEVGQPIFATEDALEGPTAFAEKRTPNFKGR